MPLSTVVLGIENTFNNCCVALINEAKKILFERNIVFRPDTKIKQDTTEWSIRLFEFHKETLPSLLKAAEKFIDENTITVDFLSLATLPHFNSHVAFARSCAETFGKGQLPIVEVDHVNAHLLSGFLSSQPLAFPFISLTIAGVHSNLSIAWKPNHYQLLGSHQQSPKNKLGHGRAIGSVLDKCAELIGLVSDGHPDGAIQIDKVSKKYDGPFLSFDELYAANHHNAFNFDFHQAYELVNNLLLAQKNHPFKMDNISGLTQNYPGKAYRRRQYTNSTARRYNTARAVLCKSYIFQIAASLQQASMNILLEKAFKAAKKYGVPRIAFGGGVAANSRLRELASMRAPQENVAIFFPAPEYCADNAVMIGLSGLINKEII